MATISFTYDIVTEESAVSGDTADHGFCDPGGWYYSLLSAEVERDTRENPHLYWQPWKPGNLRAAIRAAQDWGCTEDNGDGSFYSVDPEIDYQTGEHKSYAVHFNGFTPSTLNRIAKAIAS